MIYGINLALHVTVCLHCGELAPDGALFCAKCGYTLPQVDSNPPPPPPPTAPGRPPGALPPPPALAPRVASPASYAVPAGTPVGATGPIAPPPTGKFCIRCRTIISRSAVYCPVCQQPQTS